MVLGATLAGLMAACGGGGGNGSNSSGFGSTNGNAAFGIGSHGGSTTTNPNVISNTFGTVVLSLSSSTTSASQPATVTAVVKDAAGIPVAGALVQFTLTGGVNPGALATLSPATAITDLNGEAVTSITPQSGSTTGAAYVNATADTSAGSLTAKKAFTISAVNVSLGSVTVGQGTINGYDSTSVNIAVTGASSSTPVTVNVTSTCATNGKASISPSSLTMTGGTGQVTYLDKGCGNTSGTGQATDRINVQVVGTSQQGFVNLLVNAPTTQGIQFVSVDRPSICQRGTGCTSAANVVFKTVDQTGAPQPNLTVNFSLDNNNAASLGSTSGVTGADGSVTVSVVAKNTPAPVRVIARVGSTLQAVSNILTISGGLPVASLNPSHSGLSFAAEKFSLDALLDGDLSTLLLRLTDRYSSPAPDGTVINLVADGGTVVPAYCVTQDGTGACQVKLIVSNPKPANGRVHVVAYANGQEYFSDSNGDGVYTPSEAHDDVPDAVCLDRNENGSCDGTTEYIVGGDILDPNHVDTAWNDGGSAFARKQHTFIFADTEKEPRLFQVIGGACSIWPVDDTYMTANVGTQSRVTKQVCLRDGNTAADGAPYYGNPVAAGTQFNFSPIVTNVSVNVSASPISSSANAPTMHTITVINPSPGVRVTSGTVSIGFIIPNKGTVTIAQQIIIP